MTTTETARRPLPRGWQGRDGRYDTAGENSRTAKLTADDVRAIRTDPRPATAVAAAYGLGVQYVRRIRRGEAWGHVHDRPAASSKSDGPGTQTSPGRADEPPARGEHDQHDQQGPAHDPDPAITTETADENESEN